MGIINFTKPVTGNVFADIILWLVNVTSVVGGIVLFTLILKLITFPFDYMSRASMRKNSVKMEEMRPELEKLQLQYADNKELYNQKMMALYKKNGYSMFGACLPTILTLVIFIIAINGFTAYSQFQNRQYFYDMSLSYNNVVYSGIELDNNYIVRNEDGIVVVKDQELSDLATANGGTYVLGIDKDNDGNNDFDITVIKSSNQITVLTTNSYIKYVRDYTIEDGQEKFKGISFIANKDGLEKGVLKSEENNNFVIIREENGQKIEYTFDSAVEVLYNEKIETEYKKYLETAGENPKTKEVYTNEYKNANPIADYENGAYVKDFLSDIQKEKSAERFRNDKATFLWVKNVWVTDSPLSHPVESNWETFKTTHAYNSDTKVNEADYANLIAKLDAERNAPNGYFILVLMTAGISLLMQIIMGKAQKAQMELQTVNGQGAQTQKMMQWIMPIMMAIFAFMYTAAFSIYIVISSAISIGTTFLINAIVDRKIKKQKQAEGNVSKNVVRGRVYVPKEQPKQETKKQNKKDDKFAHENGGDFLSGKADKKHYRGRMK